MRVVRAVVGFAAATAIVVSAGCARSARLPARSRHGSDTAADRAAILARVMVDDPNAPDPSDLARDSELPDMARLFIDPNRVTGVTRRVVGTVQQQLGSYALEPGFLAFTIRTRAGEDVPVVMNEAAMIRLPGSAEETKATGYFGETDEGRPQVEPGMQFTGTIKEVRLPQVLGKTGQTFVVRGTFSRE